MWLLGLAGVVAGILVPRPPVAAVVEAARWPAEFMPLTIYRLPWL